MLQCFLSSIQYNLSLLEARDAELETYDTSFSELQAAVVDREKLLKEARSALADAEARFQEVGIHLEWLQQATYLESRGSF